MVRLNLKRPLAFFDLETTGLNICKDRIIEISILKLDVYGEIHSKTRRINPTIPIPAASSLVHGITDEDVKDLPTFKQVAKSLAEFLSDCDFGGYNVIRFDLPLLIEEFDRAGVDFDYEDRHFVDAQRIFFAKEKRTLEAAYKFYTGNGIEELGEAHSAETDTLAVFRVLQEQIARYSDDAHSPDNERVGNDIALLHQNFATQHVDLAGFIGKDDMGEAVFNFGKFKGEPIAKVLAKDPYYYDWIMDREFPVDTKRKVTQIRLAQKFSL
jgi:DNA polymerase III subunit epsilon